MQVWFFLHSQVIISGPTLPFVIFLDDTWDKKCIHVPVCFPHPGTGSEKNACSMQICFHQRGIQPKIGVLFQGTCRDIADFDKQDYKYYMLM